MCKQFVEGRARIFPQRIEDAALEFSGWCPHFSSATTFARTFGPLEWTVGKWLIDPVSGTVRMQWVSE
jgi:hypothetical protein